MQLVLERRAERSTLIAVASPLAVALTIGTFAILFAIMGKNPLLALWLVEGEHRARARCASNAYAPRDTTPCA
jgi:hypothetical protein